MTLATLPDVEGAVGRPLDAAETERVEQLLATAAAAVFKESGGYRFAPGDYTVRRRCRGGRVRLHARVATVTSVAVVDQLDGSITPATGWSLSGNVLYLNKLRACEVEIAFTVTELVPPAIVALVAGVVATTVTGPSGGASQAAVGPFQMSFIDGSGRVWFSKSDKAILAGYRPPKPAIGML